MNAQEIARKLTNEQIIYLYIAHDVWNMSDIFEMEDIQDIEDTEGTFTNENTLHMDYVDNEFDNEHVINTINAWKTFYDEEGFLIDDDTTALDILDGILFPGAMHSDFQNVKITVSGDTGSYAWETRSESAVDILDILEHANAEQIVKEFLAG